MPDLHRPSIGCRRDGSLPESSYSSGPDRLGWWQPAGSVLCAFATIRNDSSLRHTSNEDSPTSTSTSGLLEEQRSDAPSHRYIPLGAAPTLLDNVHTHSLRLGRTFARSYD